MRDVLPGRPGHSSVTKACGGCDERLSVEMEMFGCERGRSDRQGWLSKAHSEVAELE